MIVNAEEPEIGSLQHKQKHYESLGRRPGYQAGQSADQRAERPGKRGTKVEGVATGPTPEPRHAVMNGLPRGRATAYIRGSSPMPSIPTGVDSVRYCDTLVLERRELQDQHQLTAACHHQQEAGS